MLAPSVSRYHLGEEERDEWEGEGERKGKKETKRKRERGRGRGAKAGLLKNSMLLVFVHHQWKYIMQYKEVPKHAAQGSTLFSEKLLIFHKSSVF